MAALPAADELLVATIARHFPAATIDQRTVTPGLSGLTIECRLGEVRPTLGVSCVPLIFTLDGAGLRGPIELMMASYGATPQRAVLEGACAWACTFGAVLRAAFSGDVADEVTDVVIETPHGELSGYVTQLDQVLHLTDDGGESPEAARVRLGVEPWLAALALQSGSLPVAGDRVQLLSVFVGDLPDKRIVEVKLDGVPYRGFEGLLGEEPAATPQLVLLRELCVVVPS
jgi:hypothetical protein